MVVTNNDVVIETSDGAMLNLPAIWTGPNKFGPDTTLALTAEESQVVDDLGVVGRSRAMIEGIIGLVKAIGVAISLNNQESEYRAHANGLRADKEMLEAKVVKLENEYVDYKGNHNIQAGLVTELGEKNRKIEG
jgi:hypothetical protein